MTNVFIETMWYGNRKKTHSNRTKENIMVSYAACSVTEIFEEQHIILSGVRAQDEKTGRWSSSEVSLRISYEFEDSSVDISVYDMGTRNTLLRESAVTFDDAKMTLTSISKDYPKRVNVKEMLSVFGIFFTVTNGSVFIDSPVGEPSSEPCENCGDIHNNRFTFLYVPSAPGTALEEPSLNLAWDNDCNGETVISGTFDTAKKEVLKALKRMKGFATPDNVDAVERAVSTVTRHA